jgi:hypothetical protein
MSGLLGELSFHNRLKPSDVTPEVRGQLVLAEKRETLGSGLLALFITLMSFVAALVGYGVEPSQRPVFTLGKVLAVEATVGGSASGSGIFEAGSYRTSGHTRRRAVWA